MKHKEKILSPEDKNEITKISKQFAEGFKGMDISGWLIVDPLSAYLNALGYDNKLSQIPAKDKNPLILVMTFADGSQFIPAGKDMANRKEEFGNCQNWMWL